MEQELIQYTFSFCKIHNRITKFIVVGDIDEEQFLVCTEDNCGFRKRLEEMPKEKEVKKMSMKDFYEKLKKTQEENFNA